MLSLDTGRQDTIGQDTGGQDTGGKDTGGQDTGGQDAEDASAPVLAPRYGEWAFAAGDKCGGNKTCTYCGSDAVFDPQGSHCDGCSSVPARP